MINLGLLAGHNIWQSVMVLFVVACLLKLFKTTSAEDKSWSWTATLFALALMPLAMFLPGEGIKTSYFTASPQIEAVQTLPATKSQKTDKSVVHSQFEQVFNIKEENFPWLLYLWLCGVGISMISLGRGAYNASKLKKTASSYTSNGLKTPNGWPQNIKLAVSDDISGPMVLGVFNPIVLVPRKYILDLEPCVLNPLLFHELAHVKRYDNAFYIMERLILCLYWWNPVMHFTAKRISEEREKACDDRAVQLCGDPLLYAKSLLSGAKQWITKKENVLAMGIFEKESTFSVRIKRLTANESFLPNLKVSFKNITMLLAVIVTIGLLTPRLSIAQDKVSGSIAEKLANSDISEPLTEKEEAAIREEIKQEIAANQPDIEAIQKQVRADIDNAPEIDIEAIRLDVKKSMEEMEEIDIEAIRAELTKELSGNNPYINEKEIIETVELAIANMPQIDKDKMYETVMSSVEKASKIDKEEIYNEVMESLSNIPQIDGDEIATNVIKSINIKRAKFKNKNKNKDKSKS